MWCHRCAKGVQKWVAGAWRHGGFIPNWWPSDWGKWWSSIKYGDAGHCWEPNHPPNLSQFQFAGKSFHHALGVSKTGGKDSTTILFSWRSPSHHQSNNVENAIISRPFEMVSPFKIVILGDGVSHSWRFEVTNLGTNLHIDIRQVAKAKPVARRHFLIKQSKDFREIWTKLLNLLPPTGCHGPKGTADLMILLILPYHSGWGAKSQPKHGHNLTPRHRLMISCTACRPTNHHVHALSCALPARRKIQYTGCCFSLTVGKVSTSCCFLTLAASQPGSLAFGQTWPALDQNRFIDHHIEKTWKNHHFFGVPNELLGPDSWRIQSDSSGSPPHQLVLAMNSLHSPLCWRHPALLSQGIQGGGMSWCLLQFSCHSRATHHVASWYWIYNHLFFQSKTSNEWKKLPMASSDFSDTLVQPGTLLLAFNLGLGMVRRLVAKPKRTGTEPERNFGTLEPLLLLGWKAGLTS